jgi:hypothetical protein
MKKYLGVITLASALSFGIATAAMAQTDGGGNAAAGRPTDSTAGYGMQGTAAQKGKMAPSSTNNGGMMNNNGANGTKGQEPTSSGR